MKNKNIIILSVLSMALVFSSSGQEKEQNWSAKTLWESKTKIQRVIVSDIDPEHERA